MKIIPIKKNVLLKSGENYSIVKGWRWKKEMIIIHGSDKEIPETAEKGGIRVVSAGKSRKRSWKGVGDRQRERVLEKWRRNNR